MKVLVSACLMGRNCKYSGGNNYSEKLQVFLKDKEVIEVCPEVMGGLPVPRPSAELVEGHAVNVNGEDVDAYYRRGVNEVLKIIQGEKIDLAVLQSRSPACGVKQIYDGTFSRRLIPGKGLLAAALDQAGIPLLDAEDL